MKNVEFLHEGFVPLSAEQAAAVIENCRYERQRDETRSPEHISVLAEQMRRGYWLPKSQIDFARLDDKLILVNGHHRMRAQMDADQTILWSIVIHPCETIEDVRKLYYRFDTNVRARSGQNILNGIAFDEVSGLSKSVGTALWRAVPIISAGLRVGGRDKREEQVYSRRMTDDRIAKAMELLSEAGELEAIFKAAPIHIKTKLLTGGIFAFALTTMQAMPDKAREFWTGVCDGALLRRHDPRMAFVHYILTQNMRSGMVNSQVVAAARCWNAYLDAKAMQFVRVTPSSVVAIKGTDIKVAP